MCPYATPNKRNVSLSLPLEGRRSIRLSYGRVEFSRVNRYFSRWAGQAEVVVCPLGCPFRWCLFAAISWRKLLYTKHGKRRKAKGSDAHATASVAGQRCNQLKVK